VLKPLTHIESLHSSQTLLTSVRMTVHISCQKDNVAYVN